MPRRYISRAGLVALLVIIVVAGGLLLISHRPSVPPEPELIHAKIGASELYIPKEYLKFRHTGVGAKSALLQAWYPGSAIAPGSSSLDLAKEGVWWKNISILVNERLSDISFDNFARKSTEYLDATELVGDEYGMMHYTQPKGFVQDKYDVWLEKNGELITSYITCSERLIESDIPQCTHKFFLDGGLRISISYDRRFLPEWKIIKSNVEDMFDSFRSREAAERSLRTNSNE